MKTRLPILTGVLVAVALIGAAAAQAQTAQTDKAWCATDRDGAMNCLYSTLSACEATVRGEGGACVPNPDGGSR